MNGKYGQLTLVTILRNNLVISTGKREEENLYHTIGLTKEKVFQTRITEMYNSDSYDGGREDSDANDLIPDKIKMERWYTKIPVDNSSSHM